MKADLLLFAALSLVSSASAIKIQGRRNLPIHPAIGRRASLFGESGLQDTGDIQYTTNLTVNGTLFNVIADTGSADLYVCTFTDIPGSVNTGQTASLNFAVGEVQGPINLANLVFADYTVNNQAYLQVQADNVTNLPGTGLIGLGPSAGSNILEQFNNKPIGNTPLDNIFLQNTSTPNFITVLLGRADEPENPFPGDITVGETLPQYGGVTNQPKLPVTNNPADDTGNQHWQVLLDVQGVFVNDTNIPITTVVQSTQNVNQATAVFDSGFSLPQVPKSVSDAIYSTVPGAVFQNVDGLGDTWLVPCKAEINISFSFGGVRYPIHPLDASLTSQDLNLTEFNLDGELGCVGAFQPVSFAADDTFDMVLGMAFLRNAYMLINFGDFVDGTKVTAQPYIQLLPLTTNATQAQLDFQQVRSNLSAVSSSGPGLRVGEIAAIVIVLVLAAIVVGILFALRSRLFGSRGRPAKDQPVVVAVPYGAQPVTYGQQPPYGQPAYGQPAYGQPAYGQPAYGQPAYGGAPGHPGQAPPPGAPVYGTTYNA